MDACFGKCTYEASIRFFVFYSFLLMGYDLHYIFCLIFGNLADEADVYERCTEIPCDASHA
jgi:hypothetical protein